MVTCPKCGAENDMQGPLGAYCKKCGSRLTSDPNRSRPATPAVQVESREPARAAAGGPLAMFWKQLFGICLVVIAVSVYGRFRRSNNWDFLLMFLYGLNILCAVGATVRYRAGILPALLGGLALGGSVFLGAFIYDTSGATEPYSRGLLITLALALPTFVGCILVVAAAIRLVVARLFRRR